MAIDKIHYQELKQKFQNQLKAMQSGKLNSHKYFDMINTAFILISQDKSYTEDLKRVLLAAKQTAEQEISLRKDTSYTYAVLAEFEKEYNENNEKALPYIDKAIFMNPKEHQFYFIRMAIYHALGKDDLMMEDDKIGSKLLDQEFKRTDIGITLLVVISIVLAILYIFFK